MIKYKKVQKRTAEKLYNNNSRVYMCPNKCSALSIFNMEIMKTDRAFENVVNEFRYYNCNKEIGNNVSFYTAKILENGDQ